MWMKEDSNTMEKLVLFAVLICFGASQPFNDCPGVIAHDNSYYLRAFGDSCFEFVLSRQRTHSLAREECETYGGHLALVKSQAVQDFLVRTLASELRNSYDKLWIGLDDIDEEGEFKWEDGTPLTYSNWAPNMGPGSIYSGQNGNDCVLMNGRNHGRWEEIACDQSVFLSVGRYEEHYYICQYALAPTGRR